MSVVLTSQEVADIYGVALSTIHLWTKRKKIPHHRTIGGQLRYDPVALRAWAEKRDLPVPEKLRELTECPWRS